MDETVTPGLSARWAAPHLHPVGVIVPRPGVPERLDAGAEAFLRESARIASDWFPRCNPDVQSRNSRMDLVSRGVPGAGCGLHPGAGHDARRRQFWNLCLAFRLRPRLRPWLRDGLRRGRRAEPDEQRQEKRGDHAATARSVARPERVTDSWQPRPFPRRRPRRRRRPRAPCRTRGGRPPRSPGRAASPSGRAR